MIHEIIVIISHLGLVKGTIAKHLPLLHGLGRRVVGRLEDATEGSALAFVVLDQ